LDIAEAISRLKSTDKISEFKKETESAMKSSSQKISRDNNDSINYLDASFQKRPPF
jgi:hypothetical protein